VINKNMDNFIKMANKSIMEAMDKLESKKGDSGMLVITNAGYGQIDNNRSVPLIDTLSELTGCTAGRGSLLGALTDCDAPVWFSIRNNTGNTVFIKWENTEFKSQIFDASPAALLEYENWKKIAEGLIGPKTLNQVGSIGSLWFRKVPWYVLKGAELHGGACPGNFAGFFVHQYLKQNLPLGNGDHYLFVFAPPTCGMDILQLIYASSAGQKQMLSMQFGADKLASYISEDVVTFATVIRVNQVQNICEGVILGFDIKKASKDAKVDFETFFPMGLKSSPLFGFSRTKVSYYLAALGFDEQMSYISELKKFSGNSAMAQQIAGAGSDPYKVIFSA